MIGVSDLGTDVTAAMGRAEEIQEHELHADNEAIEADTRAAS